MRFVLCSLACVLSLASVSAACPLVAAPVAQAQVFAAPVAVAAVQAYAMPVAVQQQFAVQAYAAPVAFAAAPLCVNGGCNLGSAASAQAMGGGRRRSSRAVVRRGPFGGTVARAAVR